MIIGAALLTGVIAYCVARTPNYDALKAQGDTLVQQIEAYRAVAVSIRAHWRTHLLGVHLHSSATGTTSAQPVTHFGCGSVIMVATSSDCGTFRTADGTSTRDWEFPRAYRLAKHKKIPTSPP